MLSIATNQVIFRTIAQIGKLLTLMKVVLQKNKHIKKIFMRVLKLKMEMSKKKWQTLFKGYYLLRRNQMILNDTKYFEPGVTFGIECVK